MKLWTAFKHHWKTLVGRSCVMAVAIGILTWYTDDQLEDSQSSLVKQHRVMQADFTKQKVQIEQFVAERDRQTHQDVSDQLRKIQERKPIYGTEVLDQVNASKALVPPEPPEAVDASLLEAINASRKASQP